jgi:hypothetical protein
MTKTRNISDLGAFTPSGAGGVQRTVENKLRDVVSVKDFGAVGDGTTDDYAAFTAATTYCNDNNKRSLLIPPGNYSLSQPWAAPAGGSYIPCKTTGAGATLNNTVIVRGGAGIEGLAVDGSPDCGFVFIRGQGAYHSYLVSKNNGSYGFYFGVASRQHLTVNSVTNFTVGQIVTGATSGAFGTITRITGNVLELVKCNFSSTPRFFSAAETITQVAPAASTTVSSTFNPYGGNYQVTRATFEQLLAYNNGNKGFYWDGTATANQSWMNASAIISPSSVSNAGKGWVVEAFTGPGGGSEHNYNTFININCEGNGDKSLQDSTGRQNTYIGGHFVDVDGSGESVNVADSFNFQLGGRYLGTVNFNGPFSIRNMATGGVAGAISGLDSFQTNAFQADGPAFMPSGWSILPSSKIAVTIGTSNTTNHLINVNFGSFNVSNYINYRIFLGGFRNQSGGYATINHAQLIGQICSSTTSLNAINYTAVGLNGVTVNSVTITSAGLATFNLNSTGTIFSWQVIVEFWNSDGTDPR